jgi:hypothetical protein
VNGTVSVDLKSTTVGALRTAVLIKFGMPKGTGLRILLKARILKDDSATLDKCGVAADSRILLVKTADPVRVEADVKAVEAKAEKADRIAAAAAALAMRTDAGEDDSEHYFELADQNGKAIAIPARDRVALVQGMTLHEKAKKLLSRGETADALALFLAADAAFQKADPKFVGMIDNFPHLCLDIVWAFWRNRDLKRLYDAYEWLKKAEAGFERAHGRNLERVRILRNGFVPEKALYVRLHLLQAIVSFHTGAIGRANTYLAQAAKEHSALSVNDDSLTMLVSMGLPLRLSRRALRVTGGAVDRAVTYAMNKKEELAKRREAERKEREKEAEAKRYGKTALGKPIDVDTLHNLEPLGFDPFVIAAVRVLHAFHCLHRCVPTPPLLCVLLCAGAASDRQFVRQVAGTGTSRPSRWLLECSRSLMLTPSPRCLPVCVQLTDPDKLAVLTSTVRAERAEHERKLARERGSRDAAKVAADLIEEFKYQDEVTTALFCLH